MSVFEERVTPRLVEKSESHSRHFRRPNRRALLKVAQSHSFLRKS
jgi:hypothetical protein